MALDESLPRALEPFGVEIDALELDIGAGREIAQLEAITLVNASLTLASEDSKWRFVLSGSNLTDELYPVAGTSSLTTASGYSEIINSRPRTVALSATFSF